MGEQPKQRKRRKQKQKQRRTGGKITQAEAMKSVRKKMPPKTRVINPKKYDRRDRSWEEDGNDDDNT